MGTREALEVLDRQWDDIHGLLSTEDSEQVATMCAELAGEVIPGASAKKGEDLARFIARRLPREHEFRRALARDGTRLVSTERDSEQLARWLRASESLCVHLAPRMSTVGEVAREASAWLLAADAFTEQGLRARGGDPGDPELIRLNREDGTGQWPAFQFAEGSTALVRTINRILDASGDPWGVADWWLGENAWLAGIPARLLGRVDDQILIDAARAERAES